MTMRRDEHKQKGAAASCSGGARCAQRPRAWLHYLLEWQKGEMNGRDDRRERKSDTQSGTSHGQSGGGQFSDPMHA